MITALSGHKRLIHAYDDLLDNKPSFANKIDEFSAMWPVLNVRDVRKKLRRDAFWRFDHDELMLEVEKNQVKYQPIAWVDDNIPTWEQTLRTVYAVRSNLVHGSKSPQNQRDHNLVLVCDSIIRSFIDGTDCFNWRD